MIHFGSKFSQIPVDLTGLNLYPHIVIEDEKKRDKVIELYKKKSESKLDSQGFPTYFDQELPDYYVRKYLYGL